LKSRRKLKGKGLNYLVIGGGGNEKCRLKSSKRETGRISREKKIVGTAEKVSGRKGLGGVAVYAISKRPKKRTSKVRKTGDKRVESGLYHSYSTGTYRPLLVQPAAKGSKRFKPLKPGRGYNIPPRLNNKVVILSLEEGHFTLS